MRQHSRARSLVGSAFGTYIPQQLITATEVGSLFVARALERESMCLLRVLSLPPGAPEAELEEHTDRFQQAAEQMRRMQHPYLLPLVDAGVVGEVPYLVWPLIAMRPLASMDGRVAPVDLDTAGRYLDEMAAALEHAHARGLVHGNLALEGIYAQRDGRLLIGDLGVRQLIELLRQDMQWHYLYTLADPSAPEQILGRRPRSATDVYLLACALFRLLTGRQIFEGETREDVAHAHLHDPVPPLGAYRVDLPPGLDGLLAAALAKEPGNRIQRPGELANAFHEIVAPGDVTRIPFTTAGPTMPLSSAPGVIPMTRPLTYGPLPSASAGNGAYLPGNGARATGSPSRTGIPFTTSYGPAAPSLGGSVGNGLHPELPQPSPRLTRPPVSGGPVPTSRPLINSGPPPTSRPLITSRPLYPSQSLSQPLSRPRTASQPMTFVRAHPTSQPLAPGQRIPSAPPMPMGTGPVPPMRITAAPARKHGGRGPSRGGLKLALIPLLIVLIAVGGGLALRNFAGAASASGQVVFADNPQGPAGVTDALTISATSLDTPSRGSHYAAWLLNSRTEQVIPLGPLVAAADGKSYGLSFSGATGSNGTPTNLLGAGDTVEITVETGSTSAPAGRVVLEGSFPPRAFVHLGHLLVAYPDVPGGVGILTDALRQSALMDAQAQALVKASGAGDQTSVRCYAQNVVNIIEGRKGSDYRALSPDCVALKIAPADDGYGLLTASTQSGQSGQSGQQSEPGYLDAIVLHASLAATQPDATPALRQHAQHVEVAVSDALRWVRAAQSAALAVLASPGDQTQARQLQTLADQTYHGTDTNGDGRVDPVRGEAGIATAYVETQLMATIPLSPRS